VWNALPAILVFEYVPLLFCSRVKFFGSWLQEWLPKSSSSSLHELIVTFGGWHRWAAQVAGAGRRHGGRRPKSPSLARCGGDDGR
jgi:hypothetical protein